ncbi:cell surface protein SprA [Myroides pelagicus]|uniref:T9SS outer membrane translocon Sov/SprA n=1 Tax=Myroides pelagicus TaxID=270914 RepID=UPI001F033F22|nr:cell surface protein SprA [Myroides pelagicus]
MRGSSFFLKRLSIVVLLLLSISFNIYGQEELLPTQEEQNQWIEAFEQERDTLLPKYDFGDFLLPDPSVIREAYSYKPSTDRYYFTKTVGDFNVNLPLILTRKEYEELVLRSEIRKYFQQRFNAMHGRLDDEEAQRDMLPRYYVNSKLFVGIFGSNTIDVKPTGSVEFDMGVRYSKQDNPVMSARNRKNMMFDFDQRISMGLQGMVGTRLSVNANYDTQATFDFQNLMKLSFEPDEDDIVRKVEVGNVSMPITGSLIRGAQSLFGVKTELQFGRTTVRGVFSEQKSQTTSVRADGGGALEDFELLAIDYDENRHFFLSQYFRENYDDALKKYPYVNTRVRITRVEVWITNRYSRLGQTNNNARNLVAIQDLGEGKSKRGDNRYVSAQEPNFFVNTASNALPDNANNLYDPKKIGQPLYFLKPDIRLGTSGSTGFVNAVQEGRDFVKVESARKLTNSEFTYHPQLGYISLNQRLSNDEVLAVAFQYTIGDKVYQVGEFGTDSNNQANESQPTDNVPLAQNIVVKLLKSSITLTNAPIWRLMMKNIYQIPNASYISQDRFRFNILYTDPSPLNYIKSVTSNPLPEGVERTPLLKVFHLDRLNYTNDPQAGGDGFFDFIANGNMQNVFDPNNPNANMGSNGYNNQNSNNNYGNGYGNNGGFGGFGGSNGYGNNGYGTGNNNNQYARNTIDGLTIDAINGRIIFTTAEPFGEHLFNKLKEGALDNSDYELGVFNENQKKYVFKELYTGTKASAIRSQSQKNKFQLKGKYSSSMGQGIPIGAYNVAPGSVIVKAGGRLLVEGADYTVDYNRGRVIILDPALLASNTPIDVSVENNTMFGQQTKRFFGVNVEHKFNKDFIVGGSFLRLSERPMTHKSSYGSEAVNNTIWGFNAQYSTEVPFFTRLVNKLPNIDTDVESRVSFRGEFAYLQPESSKMDSMNGEATSYVDDFEGTQSTIDIKSPFAWRLASVPKGFYYKDRVDDFTIPSYDNTSNGQGRLEDGYRRAKLSWYTIDPAFYVGAKPNGVTEFDLSSNATRRVYSEELYPNKDIAYGESRVLTTLDLTYYPEERGPYNFNPEYEKSRKSSTPKNNWGGIMRSLSTSNFEQANIEALEFWLMDPYEVGNIGSSNTGQLKLNFGLISEDILRDGYKQYENGLPTSAINENSIIKTAWGKVPAAPSLIYAFDTNADNRRKQDVGLDGLSDEEEKIWFPKFAHLADPAADNFVHYLDAEGGILQRYRDYNGTEGNSPAGGGRSGNNSPDAEDVDGDNTMNTLDAYFQYGIDIKPGMQIGDRYLVDIRESDIKLADGSISKVRWLQFKVPIDKNGEKINGNSDDLEIDMRSMRFMRMFVTGFEKQVTLRFGSLNLIRSDWRKSDRNYSDFDREGSEYEAEKEGSSTAFDVTSVNIQDNHAKKPIPYVTPPGVYREQMYMNNTLVNQNEQSLALKIYSKDYNAGYGLTSGDARAVYKNFNVDMRQYKKLRMFIHAEAIANGINNGLLDDEAVAFIRIGNDLVDNYYQIEIPLKVTESSKTLAEDIWPKENELNLNLDYLTKLKIMKMTDGRQGNQLNSAYMSKTEAELGGERKDILIGIKGNPNFAKVRMMMIGVRNKSLNPIQGEFWFDELRLSDMENEGGWAATAAVDANFADFATISATGMRSTVGFGGLEQGPQQRSREDYKSYNIVTNVNLGHLLPKRWGVVLPFNYSISEEFITPEYDPNNLDLKLSLVKSNAKSSAEAEEIEKRAMDYTKRKSINFIGVNKQRNPEKKARIWDVENLTVSHSYNEVTHHDYEIDSSLEQQVRTSVDYGYSFQSKSIEPFKKLDFLSSTYLKIIKDFNFNLIPTNISFSSNVLRQYNRQQFRLLDVEGIGLDPLYRRNYFFNYNYGFNLDLTRSLRMTYVGGSNNVVRNYYDSTTGVIDESNTIWDDYFNVGKPNQFTQQVNLTYELPLNKIPFLAFVRSSYTYTGTYNWQRASEAFSEVELDGVTYSLGNTIQNSRSQAFNTTFSMETLYSYIGIGKGGNRRQKDQNKAKKATIVPGQKVVQKKNAIEDDKPSIAGKTLGVFRDLLTSVKNIQINYTENSSTLLPGYMPGVGFFGTSKPTLGFVFGSQADVRFDAARNGYLTEFPNMNQSYTQVSNKMLNVTASVRPLNDLVIDVTANRMRSDNMSEQFVVEAGVYIPQSPNSYGNFTMSTMMIRTSFSNDNAFDQFLANRLVVANKLAVANGIDISNPANLDAKGYPIGYGSNSQAVLIPAFYSAYSGGTTSKASTSIFRDVPLPNWNLRYTGLMKVGLIKDNFRKFSIHHGYRAAYTLGSYSSNYDYYNYQKNPSEFDGKNIPSEYVVNNVTMYEQFNPLVKLDLETKSYIRVMAEIRKDRMLSLSLDNLSLTQTVGNDFVLGLGYRIKDVGFNSMYANGGMGGRVESDINIKADLTLSKRETLVRYLDFESEQVGGGQDMWSLRITADYMLSKNLTAIFFYDHSFSKAMMSTMYPITNIRSGFTVRYNFGN